MRTWMWLIVVMAIACGGKKKQEDSGVGSGSAPAVVEDTVEIFVGAQSVAKLTVKELASWPRLDSLVPMEARRLGTWNAITFETRGGAPSTLERPAQSHPDKVPVVFPGKDGKPAFGMFDPVEYAKKGEPGFHVDNVREVKLAISSTERGGEHQGGGGEGADITKLVLTIVTKDGEKKLTGPEILKLPRQPQPGSEDTKGWRVTQFLEAVGVTKYQSITLIDASGTSVPLTKKELDSKTAHPFVKLNKSGVLRFRMFTKQGQGWAPGADLRGLVKIEVK
jgi:hypothetical protein